MLVQAAALMDIEQTTVSRESRGLSLPHRLSRSQGKKADQEGSPRDSYLLVLCLQAKKQEGVQGIHESQAQVEPGIGCLGQWQQLVIAKGVAPAGQNRLWARPVSCGCSFSLEA